MPVYTHCRQFPHLRGRSDDEIRGVVRRALGRRPGYRLALRARNVVILAILLGVFVAYRNAPQQQMGFAFMVAGGLATAFVLAWNILWVNVVLLRITNESGGEDIRN